MDSSQGSSPVWLLVPVPALIDSVQALITPPLNLLRQPLPGPAVMTGGWRGTYKVKKSPLEPHGPQDQLNSFPGLISTSQSHPNLLSSLTRSLPHLAAIVQSLQTPHCLEDTPDPFHPGNCT